MTGATLPHQSREPELRYGMYWTKCLNCGGSLLVLDLVHMVVSGQSVEVNRNGAPKPRFCKECFAMQQLRRNAS